MSQINLNIKDDFHDVLLVASVMFRETHCICLLCIDRTVHHPH